jgi:hypothetical protein
MPLISTSVPNLVQGVSQQPDNLRYPGQAEEQINAFSSVVDGLNKRPHRELIKGLGTTLEDDALIHFVDRDPQNKHAMIFNHNGGTTSVNIVDVTTGNAITTNVSASAEPYLNSITSPLSQLRALTVADYTFVANTNKAIEMTSDVSDALEYEALVFVKLGDYSKEYNIFIDDEKFTYRSGDGQGSGTDSTGGSAGDGSAADTEYIASQLDVTLETTGSVASVTVTNGGSGYTSPPDVTFPNPGGGGIRAEGYASLNGGVVSEVVITKAGSGYTSATIALTFSGGGGSGAAATGNVRLGSIAQHVMVRGNLLKVSHATTDFNISVTDGLSDQALGVIYKEVSSIAELPQKCFNGFKVKIKGDVELVQDDYYVKFVTKDNKDVDDHFGEGSWEEDVGYGVKTTLDNTTMPIQIVPTLDVNGVITSYQIDVASWTGRLVGDDDTNPLPSFVTTDPLIPKKINDLFFFKNRLGILTDTAVLFSEADEYFNFFRTTTLSLLDSAPIDVGVAHTKVSKLTHASAFQEKLILFSPQSQFVLRGSDLLTAKTVNISPITEYNVSSQVRPLSLTNYVYFSFQRDSYEGIYEFFVDQDSQVFDASEITQQVPTFLQGNLRSLSGSASENVIVASSDDDLSKLFVYKYYWSNKEKIQSAWMRFDFDKEIVGMGFIDSDLFIVTKDGYLEKMAMESGHKDPGYDYALHLDRRIDNTYSGVTLSSYDTINRTTTISGMPYDPEGAVVYTKTGRRLPITRLSATSFTVRYDVTDKPFFVGFEYEMSYTFSIQTLKQPTERGGRSSSNFTKQLLRNGAIDYSDTGHFTVEVTPLYRDTYSYAFNPTKLGADAVIGSLVLDSGSFRFPIQARHDEVEIKLTSTSALPMKLLSAEFENFVHSRSKRYG